MPESHRIALDSLAYGGDAVGRLDDGRIAFVSGGVPGDVAIVEIAEERARFVKARVTEIVEASRDRVTPPCPYFGVCGGCQWQMVAYPAQLAAKRAAVVDALERIGKVEDADALTAPCTPSPLEYGYRNKVELHARQTPRGLRLGFLQAASDDLVEIDRCLLLPKRAQKLPKAIGGALRYVQGAGDLGISRVGVRVAANTSDLEVAVWTPTGAFPRHVAAETLSSATKATSIVRVMTKEARGRTTTGVEVLAGKGMWRERLLGLGFSISAPSFFQVNTAAAELLVGAAVDRATGGPDVDADDRDAIDLFSGAGTFTLPLAERFGMVTAVEAEGSAVRDLRRNLENAQLFADVRGGDANRELAELAADVIVVDPPRAGLGDATPGALADSGATRIVYVSCDPTTLARDAHRLAEHGFDLVSAEPFDLFPQTWHVETLATFERRA